MQIFFSIASFILWLLLGSFWSVWVSRSKNHLPGIICWNSECPHCHHALWFFDLVPIFSYIFLWGKCRYCKTKISPLYPMLEIVMAFGFLGIYFISENIFQMISLFIAFFLSVIVSFYDILYREIPEKTLLALNIFLLVAATSEIILTTSFESLSKDFFWSGGIAQATLIALYAIIFLELYAVFDLMILWMIAFIFFFCFQKYTTFFEYNVLTKMLAGFIVYCFFYLQILLSKGKWLGWWDLRIAIAFWLLSGLPLLFPAVFVTYFLWSVIGILYIFWQKKQKKSDMDNALPFWPFLFLWAWWAIFFSEYYQKFINFILNTPSL